MQSFTIHYHLNVIYRYDHVPGHAEVLQSVISDVEPGQLLPAPDGAGLLQVLFLDFCPVPHVLVHVEYAPHAVHIPFTKNRVLTTLKGN